MIAAEDRPPYVSFEVRSTEDRTASLAAGHYVSKDVDYALITPVGGRDMVERPVEDWLNHLEAMVREQRFSATWYDQYRTLYKMWKEKQELPETGIAVRNWPMASPSDVKSLLDANVRTVEDLAAANEETLNRIGMGSRALKDRAVAFLRATGPAKVANELASLQAENANLRVRNESLEARIASLEALATQVQTANIKVSQKAA